MDEKVMLDKLREESQSFYSVDKSETDNIFKALIEIAAEGCFNAKYHENISAETIKKMTSAGFLIKDFSNENQCNYLIAW